MSKGKSKHKGLKKKDGLLLIAAGAALILLVSLLEGFAPSFVHAVEHIISDLTVEIKMHAYIAGLVLLMYGLYKRSRS